MINKPTGSSDFVEGPPSITIDDVYKIGDVIIDHVRQQPIPKEEKKVHLDDLTGALNTIERSLKNLAAFQEHTKVAMDEMKKLTEVSLN